MKLALEQVPPTMPRAQDEERCLFRAPIDLVCYPVLKGSCMWRVSTPDVLVCVCVWGEAQLGTQPCNPMSLLCFVTGL